ncbi:hypothetical protein [Frankia sp. Cr1]|uniref:hypothetical protein n=1 Tax=Frankia sp. Cr1 TaxID=3073931 RepID=UPI002AD4B18D|nr:hypothetical protein [Frankia sp. Cr1]
MSALRCFFPTGWRGAGSKIEARAGAGPASRHQIDLAQAALAEDHPAPAWFDFYDAT